MLFRLKTIAFVSREPGDRGAGSRCHHVFDLMASVVLLGPKEITLSDFPENQGKHTKQVRRPTFSQKHNRQNRVKGNNR